MNALRSPSAVSYPWPALPGQSELPVWTGRGFQVGGTHHVVLSYAGEASGWSDELTSFHVELAGDQHPIDRASRATALRELRHLRPGRPVILEVGCSSGFMLRAMRARLPEAVLIGADYVRGPLEELAISLPDVPLLQFDLTACPLPAASVDAVVMLNVLEHIADDGLALRQVARVLRPGGLLVLEVPAGPQLYDVYDKLLMHQRRYTRAMLHRLVRAAGMQVIEASHLGVLAYPAFALVKLRNRRYLREPEAVQRQIVGDNIQASGSSRLFELVTRVELVLGHYLAWPFGIRCTLAARKPLPGRAQPRQ